MKHKVYPVLFFLLSIIFNDVKAQVDSLPPVIDGYRNLNVLVDATPFQYPNIKEGDVKFYKRIWRDIDIRQPENHVLITPEFELITILLEGIKNKKIGVYDPSDDSFKKPLSATDAEKRLQGDSVLVPIKFDDQGNATEYSKMLNEFNPEKIVKFRIKEDVFYDKKRSKVETRIVGIAPLMKLEVESLGDSTLTTPAFWLYFPHCRTLFADKDISNLRPEYADMSLDDYFVQRKFASKIIRESNPSNQKIADYSKDAESQKKEEERIEQSILDYKKKVWTYTSDKTE